MITLILCMALMMPILAAATDFGYNNLKKPTLSKTIINYTEKSVNSSQFWDNLDTPADITQVGTLIGLNVSGNVGIGTSTPLKPLHLVGDARLDGRIHFKDGEHYIDVNSNDFWYRSNEDHIFYSGGFVEAMRIDSNQNVGIGTATPTTNLHISDASNNVQLLLNQTSGNNVAFKLATTKNNAREYQFRSDGNDFEVLSSSDTGRFVGRTSTGRPFQFNLEAPDNSFVHDKDGEVGIGGASSYKFSVFGDVNLNDTLYVNKSGNVGIGTTTPTHELNVVGNTNITGDLIAGGNATINIPHTSFYAYNDSGDNFAFGTQNVFYNFTMDNFEGDGFAASVDGDGAVAQISGGYKVSYSASGSGEANHIYKIGIFVNGVAQENTYTYFRTSNSNDVVAMSDGSLIDLAVGDIVTLQIADTTGTGTGKRYQSTFSLYRLGGIH